MKVLVTGSNGFFGRIICQELMNSNILYDLPRNEYNKSVRLEKEVPHFHETFDLVIHAAGKAHLVPKTKEQENEIFETNIIGTVNLLKGLEYNELPERVVFISSVSVYGLDSGIEVQEDSMLLAKEPYGLSKIKAEEVVMNWCNERNVKCTILRLPLLIGRKPTGNLRALVRGVKYGYYFNIGLGSARKSMVLAEDVAKFIPIVSKYGGIYNLTDGKHPSMYDISRILSNKKIRSLPIIIANLIAIIGDIFGDNALFNSRKLKKITSNLTFDDSRARRFGWQPRSVIDYLEKHII